MKKKGSALIFSILILSFFLAVSLNIYFLARKKAEAAGVKVRGEKITSNIDIASSLGYQELYIAENFVRLGFPYKDSHTEHIKSYSKPDEDAVYFNPMTGIYNEKYSGIQLTEIIDYFTANWDYETGDKIHQKLIMSEEVVTDIKGDKVVKTRMWQSGGVPEKAIPLWSVEDSDDDEKRLSIGGYHLYKLVVNGSEKDISMSSGEKNPREFIKNNLTSDPTQTLSAYYIKFITLREDTVLGIPEMKFEIKLNERFSAMGSDGDEFDELEFYGRRISGFTVKYLEE